jgi:hypothetical protein
MWGRLPSFKHPEDILLLFRPEMLTSSLIVVVVVVLGVFGPAHSSSANRTVVILCVWLCLRWRIAFYKMNKKHFNF